MKRAQRYGEVYIISNASCSWIKKCLQNFYPRLYEAIVNKRSIPVEIVSARDLFADSLPNDPLRWKVLPTLILGERFY